MEGLDDIDDLPGMPMPAGSGATAVPASPAQQHLAAAAKVETPPDSPAKRLKRGFEQLELADMSARSGVLAHSVGAAAGSTSEGEPLEPGFLDSRRTLSSTPVRRVAIVGGTHGNERNGVALAQHFIDCPQHIARPSFESVAVIGNPAAVQANQRYVEVDMNRCFEAHVLDVRYCIPNHRSPCLGRQSFQVVAAAAESDFLHFRMRSYTIRLSTVARES